MVEALAIWTGPSPLADVSTPGGGILAINLVAGQQGLSVPSGWMET
jgi:hypothetical protein